MAADEFYALNPLSSFETFQVLAHLGKDALRLHLSGVLLWLHPGGEARFVIPEPALPGGKNHDKNHDAPRLPPKLYKALKQAVGEASGEKMKEQAVKKPNSGGLLTFPSALGWLLLHSKGSLPARESSRSNKLQGEWLILASNPDPAETLAVFEQLNAHPTCMRVGRGKNLNGEEAALFHIRDDAVRTSTFGALLNSGRLDGMLVLTPFETEEGLVFLPSWAHASAEILTNLALIGRSAPSLLGLSGPPSNGRAPLLAISCRTLVRDGERVDILPLDRVRFLDKTSLWPPATARVEAQLHSLEDCPAGLDNLRNSLERVGGCRLSLRRIRPDSGYDCPDLELERLHSQIAHLEEKAAYLASMRRPRPTLLRFTHDLLPAMADALRRFPPGDLGSGLISYGYSATARRPEGLHYLLFSPDSTVMAEPFPDAYWRSINPLPIVFNLDPFWAAHYCLEESQSLIFTPRGFSLHPALHSWNPLDMDEYLRKTIGAWSARGEDAVPDRPIFIFEEVPENKDKIEIQILDREAFQPVAEKVGWINENLELLDQVEMAEVVSALASRAGAKNLLERLKREESGARQRFDAEAKELREFFEGRLAKFLTKLKTEANQTAQQAEKTGRTIEKTRQELTALEELMEQTMEAQKNAVETVEKARVRAEGFLALYGQTLGRIEQTRFQKIRPSEATDDGALALLERLEAAWLAGGDVLGKIGWGKKQ